MRSSDYKRKQAHNIKKSNRFKVCLKHITIIAVNPILQNCDRIIGDTTP